MTTLEELEARVAAPEAAQADYRAVLATVNALSANQREIATTARVRSLEEGQVEIKDLLVRALEK